MFLDWNRTERIHTNSYPHCCNTLTTSATSKMDRLFQVGSIFISLYLPSFVNAGNSYSVQIPSLFLPCVSYCLFLFIPASAVHRLSWGHWKPCSSHSWLNYIAVSKLQTDSSPSGIHSAPTFLISTFLDAEKMCTCLVSHFLCSSVFRMPSTTYFFFAIS